MLLPGVRRDFMSTPDAVLRFQTPEPTFGQYLGEHVAEGFDHTTASVVLTEKRVQDAERAAYGDYAPALTEAATETGEWAGAPVPQRAAAAEGHGPGLHRKRGLERKQPVLPQGHRLARKFYRRTRPHLRRRF